MSRNKPHRTSQAPSTPAAPLPPARLRLATALARPRVRRWAPAAAAGLALLVSTWTFDAKLGVSGDNTEFITLARSLAAGEGLTYTHLPEPRPATKYPFGFPLMLAPLAAWFGGWSGPGTGTPDWVAMKWLVVLTFAAALALLYALARDQAGDGWAAAASLLAVTNPLLVSYGHQVMSEVPYLALSLLALLLLQRGVAREGWQDNRWLWGGVAAALAAYYTRSVGIVLLGALVAHLLLRRDWRRAGLAAAVSFAALLPWALRNRAAGGGGVYLKQLIQVNPYFPDQGLLDPAGLAGRVLSHTGYYLSDALVRALWPTLGPAAGALNPGSAVLLALLAWFAWTCWRDPRWRLLLIYAAFFTGTVLLWPWPGDRFFVPLLPLLLLFCTGAVAGIVVGLRGRGAGATAPILGAVLLALALQANARGLGRLGAESRGDYRPEWRNYFEAGLWLRSHSPPDAVVTCRKAFWMHVVSGRRTFTYAFAEPGALLRDLEAKGTDYAVVEQLGYAHTARFLVPAIQAARDRFRVVWHRPRPDTYVLRFGPASAAP